MSDYICLRCGRPVRPTGWGNPQRWKDDRPDERYICGDGPIFTEQDAHVPSNEPLVLMVKQVRDSA